MRSAIVIARRFLRASSLVLPIVSIIVFPRLAWSADGADAAALREIKTEIRDLARDRERDLEKIKLLEKRLEQVESENSRLKATDARIETQTSATTQQLQSLKQVVDTAPTAPSFDSEFGKYLGSHQLTIAGAAAGSFIYDRQSAINTFALTFEPLFLYRLNDWLLFEGTIEANFPAGSSADFQSPVADAHIFLNDYMEVVAGIFDQPFGDFDEAQSPVWVNRFVSAPLPYGAEAIVPPNDVGVQLRGGIQWGTLGQDFDYTTWVSNGPSYDNTLPKHVVGEIINPVNNIALNSNSKTFGARFRFFPFPLDANLGRLELGASTLDGKWRNSLAYNSWGVDFAYEKGNLQARGEYLEAYRELPAGSPSADNRQGWYAQVGYFLNGLRVPHEPDEISRYVDKLELLARYSGVNQRAIVGDEISTVPALGSNGSGSIFTPHAREVALGLDYWFAPSIVWQNELDFELPQAGGYISTFGSRTSPLTVPAGATANDRALLSQFTVGF